MAAKKTTSQNIKKEGAKKETAKKQVVTTTNTTDSTKVEYALGKENYIFLIIGFFIIIMGFILMVGGGSDDPNVFNGEELFSFRRITLAPLVVLFGFGFEIWAIMRKPKAKENNQLA